MATNFRVLTNYRLDEHAYVFSSLIYAFLIVEFFKNSLILNFANNYLAMFLSISLSINNFSIHGWFYFFASVFYLLFILESWWGSKLEQQKLNSFFSYVIFLFHPLTLWIFQIVFFNKEQFVNKDIYSQQGATQIFLVSAMVLIVLIFVRTYFSKKPPEFKSLYDRWDRFFYILAFTRKRNKDRIRTSLASLIFAGLSYLFWGHLPIDQCIIFLQIFYFILLALAYRTLFRHIKDNSKKFNMRVSRKFVDDIIKFFLPQAFRNKNCYGFLLFNKQKVPDRKINFLISKIRQSDVYNSDDSQIFCCFLNSDKDLNQFEDKLKIWSRSIDATIHLENKEIIFVYKLFDSNFDKDRYRLEFEALYDYAESQLS